MEKQRIIDLAKKASQGELQAFEALYKEKSRSILFSAYSILNNYHDAQDVAQEVVVGMYKNIGSLKNPQYFDTWLQKIIRNVCTTLIRKKYKGDEYAVDDYEIMEIEELDIDIIPDGAIIDDEIKDIVARSIIKLPEHQKQPIYLFYFEGLDYQQISDVLDMPKGSVSTNIARGKKKLRKILEKDKRLDSSNIINASSASSIALSLKHKSEELFPGDIITEFQRNCSKLMKGIVGKGKYSGLKTGFKVVGTVVVGTILTTVIMLNIISPDIYKAQELPPSTVPDKSTSVADNHNDKIKKKKPEQKKTTATDDKNDNQNNIVKKKEEPKNKPAATVPQQIGQLEFLDGDCDCNHVNPKTAIVKNSDAKSSQLHWKIIRETDNKTVFSGKGKKITKELKKLLDDKQDGIYIISYNYTNSSNEKLNLKRVFYIYSEQVFPDQFE